MAEVFSPDGSRRTVKNLRWLIAHRHDVTRVLIEPRPESAALLTCTFETGLRFVSTFASLTVCRDWVAKRFAPQIVFER